MEKDNTVLIKEFKKVLQQLPNFVDKDKPTPREIAILSMRFGITDGEIHTLENTGKAFGVTRERVRQIQAKTLEKIRHLKRNGKIDTALDKVFGWD